MAAEKLGRSVRHFLPFNYILFYGCFTESLFGEDSIGLVLRSVYCGILGNLYVTLTETCRAIY